MIDTEDEESGENLGDMGNLEDCFDFSDFLKSIDTDSDYTPGPSVLHATATSAHT